MDPQLENVGVVDAVVHAAGIAHRFGRVTDEEYQRVNVDGVSQEDKLALYVQMGGLDKLNVQPNTAGKDGVIKHVMSGVNPQGTEVYSFKAPSAEELDHDSAHEIVGRELYGRGKRRRHTENLVGNVRAGRMQSRFGAPAHQRLGHRRGKLRHHC